MTDATHPELVKAQLNARDALGRMHEAIAQATRRGDIFPATEADWAYVREQARRLHNACELRNGLQIIQQS